MVATLLSLNKKQNSW